MAAYVSSLSLPNSDRPQRHSELFFDVVIRYAAVASGLLSALAFGGEFLSSGASCSDIESSSEAQADFVNKWCSSRHLGPTKVFSYDLALQGILIYAPSLLWNRAFAPTFTSFFADVDSLTREHLRFGQTDK